MSLENEIYEAIWDSVKIILGEDSDVVQAYQDTPGTTGEQITIGLPSLTEIGHPTTLQNFDEDKISLNIDYIGTIDLWQTNGLGELLRECLASFNSLEIRSFLSSKNIVIKSIQEINFLPRKKDENWVKEWQTELRIASAVNYEESRSTIESISYINNIEE